MKKILLVILVAALAFIGYQGYKYYDDRYNGKPYYVQVTQQPKQERQKADNGEDMGMGYVYNFTAKAPDGTSRTLEVIEYDKPLAQGAWIKITASKTIVNKVETISVNDVPAQAK